MRSELTREIKQDPVYIGSEAVDRLRGVVRRRGRRSIRSKVGESRVSSVDFRAPCQPSDLVGQHQAGAGLAATGTVQIPGHCRLTGGPGGHRSTNTLQTVPRPCIATQTCYSSRLIGIPEKVIVHTRLYCMAFTQDISLQYRQNYEGCEHVQMTQCRFNWVTWSLDSHSSEARSFRLGII